MRFTVGMMMRCLTIDDDGGAEAEDKEMGLN
jgi:hypothetical protein